MSTMRPIGLLLFDAPSASERKARSAQRPLDGIRDLTQALGGSSAQRRSPSTALPDFVSAANIAALRGNSATSASAAFTVTRAPVEPIRVTSLASAAHAQSQGFGSLDDEITAGTLGLTVGGRSYSLNIAQGSTLKDVVAGVRALGAPVDVSVDSDGSKLHLGIKNRNTGFDPGGTAADALVINQSATGSSGQALGLTVDHQASNAVYTLRGVTSVRTSNRVTDDITGASIDLTNPASAPRPGLDDDQLTLSGPRGVGAARNSALVQIDSLARSAQVQSALFDSERDTVKAGTLSLKVEGKSYDVNIKAGDTLADVRRGIENSGAAVSAKIVTDNGGVRLSITSQATGYPLKGRPADALTVSATSTGSSGRALNPTTTQDASNASITVNGAGVSSRSNTINGALPGLTVNAQHVSASAELIALPGSAAVRPPLNVENEVNRVLQAHLLNPRNFGLVDNDSPKITVKEDNKPTDESSWSSPARKLATGGTESSRRDIQQKLTAVDDIFGGLRAARTLLTAANPSSADAQ